MALSGQLGAFLQCFYGHCESWNLFFRNPDALSLISIAGCGPSWRQASRISSIGWP
jgi:hypothetical protein